MQIRNVRYKWKLENVGIFGTSEPFFKINLKNCYYNDDQFVKSHEN